MTKKMILIMCVILIPFGLCAEFGVKAGLNISNLNISKDIPAIDFNNKSSLRIGAFYSFSISKNLSLQPEIHFCKKGSKVKDGNIDADYSISYIEVPVLLHYTVNKDSKTAFGLYGGSYLAFKTSGKASYTAAGQSMELDLDPVLKKSDFGLVIGADCKFDVGSGKLVLDMRYSIGLSNIGKNVNRISNDLSNKDKVKNRSFSVMVGYAF